MQRYFKKLAGVANGSYIYYWKSNDCLRKELIILKRIFIVLLQIQVIIVPK